MSNPESLEAIVQRCFAPIMGMPSWDVSQGSGSFLNLRFGSPHLIVKEPEIDKETSEFFRQVWLRGDYLLWIYCCHWALKLHKGQKVHSESSRREIASALKFLNGQALTAVQVNPEDGSSSFSFDLGATLLTSAYEESAPVEDPFTNWMLFQEKTGFVLIYRADGRYSYQLKSEPPENIEWL